ncbi:MAG TPA: choice-of-anchor D domain-containing protein [Candidatus Acidoferrum sp.]|nr:choice-of-anchor D domain-containing protein [Candidatus Acidoferrum sp.]
MKASSYVFSPFPFQRCALLLLLVGIAAQGLCQTPQQHVYATGTPANNANAAVISGFDKNTLSGSLAAIPSSPFSAHNAAPMAVDGQGKFLFVAGPTSIAMYEIDPASGALTEVPHSPFPYIPTLNANQAPSDALSIATEPTGQFVYVGFQNGDFPGNPQGNSSITPYVIDTSNAADPVLVLGPQLSLDFNAQPVKLFVEPTGRHLYIALGTGGGNSYGGFDLFDIDGSTGELSNLRTIDTPDVPSQVSAMDPEGRFLFQAYGQYGGWLSSFQLPPADGLVTMTSSVYLGPATFAHALAVDPGGNFLYVNVGGAPPSFNTYSIDQTTGALAQLSSSTQTPFPFGQLTVADPQGPYLYTLLSGSLHGFQVNSTTGAVTELSGSPFSDGSSNYYESGLYITNTNPQASSGPYLEISGGGAFPQTPVGQSAFQTVGLSNLGNMTMSLTSLTIAGDATSSFSQTNTCTAVLTPNAACQVTINFTPTTTGVLGATLQVVDNAPGSPQSVTLSGVGTSPATPQPQVSLSASSLSFGSQTQGTSGTPQVITLTNTGSATLHISGVTLTGTFAKDWSETQTCTAAAIAPQGTCTISVNFSPSDNGILSAVLSIADDAPSSPQTVNLYGNAPPAVLLNASASGGSTMATVSAGQTATYNLQAMPGPNFAGMITFTCSGVPFGAQCTVPASVTVANGVATPFTVSISTLSPSQAAMFPGLPRQPSDRLRPQPGFSFAFFAALLLFALVLRSRIQLPVPPRWLASVTAVLLVTALVFSGIGCGSAGSLQSVSQPPPQSAATPVISPVSGTYTAAQSVTITDTTAGTTIHYTADGSTPTASSPAYQAAISLSSLTTVQAMAIAPNYANSAVASATFKFQTPSGTITLTPTATPGGSSKQLQLTPILLTLNVQ